MPRPSSQTCIAVRLRDVYGIAPVALGLRHPDAAIVAERFAHQRQLRLVIAADRDAGRVDLRKTRIGKQRAFAVRAPDRGRVGTAPAGREKKDVAITAGRQHHRIGSVRLDLAGHKIARDDALGVAVDDDQFEHFSARKQLNRAELDAPHHC